MSGSQGKTSGSKKDGRTQGVATCHIGSGVHIAHCEDAEVVERIEDETQYYSDMDSRITYQD